jgi:translation initiation factor 2-like protein/WD40 repeat protein
MFEHLDPPTIPEPGPERLAAVKARAVVRRRHLLWGAGGAGAATVALIVVLVMALVGSGSSARRVSVAGQPGLPSTRSGDVEAVAGPTTTTGPAPGVNGSGSAQGARPSSNASNKPGAKNSTGKGAGSAAAPGPPIAFTRDVPMSGCGCGNVEIWMMDADGSGQRRIASFPEYATTVVHEGAAVGDWSPDGQRLIAQASWVEGRDDSTDVTLYDRLGHEIKTLKGVGAAQGVATWSPDGTQIAIPSCTAGDTNTPKCIDIYDVATGNKVHEIDGVSTHVAEWAPSARLAVVTGGVLETLDPDGGNVRRLGQSTGEASPRWSSDGRILYSLSTSYASGRDYVIRDTDGAVPEPVCGLGDGAWSADGRLVAVAVPPPPQQQDYTVSVCPSGGGPPLANVAGGGFRDPPTFDSSGRVVFTRGGGVWVMNADGSGQTRLADGDTPKPAPR